jgi:hypothetical protein
MSSGNPIAPLGGPAPAEDKFKIYTFEGNVQFLTKAVQPPSAVYVDQGADLFVEACTSQTNEQVIVNYRLLRFDGDVILGQFIVSPPNTRLVLEYQESLTEGFLLSVSCKSTVALTRGQTFVRIGLTDPALGLGNPTQVLFADYVTDNISPGYPGGRVLSPVEGPGWVHAVTVANPAAGAECHINIPTNVRWKVLGFLATFQPSAVVANRIIVIAVISAGFGCWTGPPTQGVPASIPVTYTAGMGVVAPATSPRNVNGPLPNDMILVPVGDIHTSTLNIDPGDQYSNVQMVVEEWLDNV